MKKEKIVELLQDILRMTDKQSSLFEIEGNTSDDYYKALDIAIDILECGIMD